MAYAIAWNESNPVGASTAMSDVDAELQNLKKSIRERMNDILENAWETDASNPKLLIEYDKARIYLSGTQTVADASPAGWVGVTFGAESYDVGSLWVVGTPARFTIVKDGKYRIYLNIPFDTGAGSVNPHLRFRFRLNESSDLAISFESDVGAAAPDHLQLETIVALSAADTVDVEVENTTDDDVVLRAGETVSYAEISQVI